MRARDVGPNPTGRFGGCSLAAERVPFLSSLVARILKNKKPCRRAELLRLPAKLSCRKAVLGPSVAGFGAILKMACRRPGILRHSLRLAERQSLQPPVAAIDESSPCRRPGLLRQFVLPFGAGARAGRCRV